MPRPKAILIILFLVALAFRLIWALQVMPDRKTVMGGDGEDYFELAVNIARGHGMSVLRTPAQEAGNGKQEYIPTAERPPLYPAFAAGLMALVSPIMGEHAYESYGIVIVAQAALDSLSVMLIFLLAREWGGWRVGLVAAVGYALNFYMIKFACEFMTEALFICLQTAALLVLVHALRGEGPSYGRVALAGVITGLATLARPVLLLFSLVAAAWIVLSRRGQFRPGVAAAMVFLLAYGVTLFPWSLRNRLVLGKWVAVSTIGGQTLYYSSHETSRGRWTPLPLPPEAKGLSEVDLEAYYYRKTWEFMSANPGVALRNACFKVLQMYYVFYPEYDFFFGVTLLLALPGAWFYFRGGGRNWLPVGLIVYMTLLCAIFLGIPRYRAPILPCFLIFAGYYVAEKFWQPGAAARAHRAYVAAVLAGNLFLVIFGEPVRVLIKGIVG